MSAAVPPLMEAMGRAMRQMELRQKVVAENVANADTPHFRAREVAAPEFGQLLADQLPAASALHIARPRVAISDAMAALGAPRPHDDRILEDRDASETKPDGNDVVLEDQLLKMGELRADFTAMTNLYRKQMALLNTALGHSG